MIDDPFDLLRTHVRHQAATIESTTAVDELIAHIMLEHERAPSGTAPRRTSAARAPRRWSSAVVGLALAVGIGTGAVVTAAVLDRVHVERPDQGPMCRPSVDERVTGLSVGATVDPIGACAAMWNAGALPVVGEKNAPTNPHLVACAGSGGPLEVFPGEGDEVCTAVGLLPADLDALAADPLIELSEGMSQINERCLRVTDAQRAAAALLQELDLEGWRVVLQEDNNGEGCGTVALQPGDSRVLNVSTRPLSP